MKIKLFGRTIEIKKLSSLPSVRDDDAWNAYLAARGYPVDANTALKVAAVYRCVDVIAKTMAALPLHLFEDTEAGKEKARSHRLYPLLYVLPNPQTTAYEFWHMYYVNLLLTRGAFAKIVRDRGGYVTALYNIPTGCVSPIYTNMINGERYIDVLHEDGRSERLRDGEFMFTPSLRFGSTDNPTDPIKIAADVLSLTVGLNSFAKSTFESGAHPGGFIETPAALSDTAYARFKKDFYDNYGGALNAGKFLFLEEGSKANLLQRDLEKTQVIESRKFAVIEICRIFGVPPHKVFDLERSTFSNIEHQSIEFVQDCITPNAVKVEQTIFKDLLSLVDRKRYFAKFNINGLLRGDMSARKEYYSSMHQNGIMNADEIRALEDMNDIPDGLGKEYFMNGNMITRENASKNIPKGAKA
jgi:HK97 family phage portal protein